MPTRFQYQPNVHAASILPTLALVLAQAAADFSHAQSPAEALLALDRPLVIAHRGYSAAAPENTLPAFQLGVEAGSDLVELDYHHSKDGTLTVLHDFTLDRTTDAARRFSRTNLAVASFTFEELKPLDASSWRGTGQPPAGIPSLDQALDLIQKGSVTLIERKAGPARDCVDLVRRRSLLNKVVVQSFDWAYLEEYHKLEPTQILGALGPWGQFKGQKLAEEEKWLSTRWIDEAKRIGARVLVWNRQVNADAIQAAHDRGMKVWVYTIDDPAQMRNLLGLGVDGLISNNPGLVWKTLATPGQQDPGLPPDWPLVLEEHFDSPLSLQRFSRTDPDAWKHTVLPAGAALELVRQSRYTPPVRSPVNMALIDGLAFDDFILEGRFLQTGREYGHRDMCVFFGYRDPSHFYYAHVATAADDHAHNVFIVDGAPRRKIASRTTTGVHWGRDAWHRIRIERRAASGLIRVYFDNLTTPIMEATDTTFPRGGIGFGSFDDTGRIDDIQIWAPAAPASVAPFRF